MATLPSSAIAYVTDAANVFVHIAVFVAFGSARKYIFGTSTSGNTAKHLGKIRRKGRGTLVYMPWFQLRIRVQRWKFECCLEVPREKDRTSLDEYPEAGIEF